MTLPSYNMLSGDVCKVDSDWYAVAIYVFYEGTLGFNCYEYEYKVIYEKHELWIDIDLCWIWWWSGREMNMLIYVVWCD